jgi:hypothetical protein
VQFVAPVDVSLSWDSPLSLVRKLCELTGAEFQFRRVGTTGYVIDLLVAINEGTGGVPDVRVRKNLIGLQQKRQGAGQVTRVFPRGATADGYHGTIGDALWKVVAISGTVVTLADPAGVRARVPYPTQVGGTYTGVVVANQEAAAPNPGELDWGHLTTGSSPRRAGTVDRFHSTRAR